MVSKLAIKKQEDALTFKGLSEDGWQAKFAENLRATLFNEDLPNETTFSLIHLPGQYLKMPLTQNSFMRHPAVLYVLYNLKIRQLLYDLP
jgi:hypothetical protein